MKCDNCTRAIPRRVSHCSECGAKSAEFDSLYSDVPMSEQEAKDHAESAMGDFEPNDLISKKGGDWWDWTVERPIGDYVKPYGEDIHYLLYAKKSTAFVLQKVMNKRFEYTADSLTRPRIVITSGRTLAVVPVDGTDIQINIPHEDVTYINRPVIESGSKHTGIVLICDDAHYSLPISKEIPAQKREEVMEFLGQQGIDYAESLVSETDEASSHSATETRIDDTDATDDPALAAFALSSEAFELDSIIEDSATSSELASEVADRFAEEWERELPDDRVEDASTVEDLVVDAESAGAKQAAKVECPNCESWIYAYRDHKGRVLITSTGGLILGGVGAGIGSIVGLATGGWGTVATVPFGAAGAVIGGGLGYILGDQVDQPHCPKCEEPIDLGI